MSDNKTKRYFFGIIVRILTVLCIDFDTIFYYHTVMRFVANVKMPPAGHYGDVEKEIGRACVQLASPDFKYMNGETITLEGGMGQRP